MGVAGVALPLPWRGDDVGRGDQALAAAAAARAPGAPSSRRDTWKQRLRAAFRPVNCPDVDRSLDDSSYQGPLIDTHMHIAALPDSPPGEPIEGDGVHPILGVNIRMTDLVCMMDSDPGGTTKVFGFFPVWEPITPYLLKIVKRTMQKYPDRFVPFLMPPDGDNDPGGFPTVDAGTLAEMLEVYPGLFQGYGEIGLYARQGGAAELPPDSPRLRAIYPVVKTHGLVVYVHLGAGQRESFERVLEQNPDIDFIWHGDQLVSYEEDGQNLEALEEILSEHPNAYYGVDELYGDVWLLRPEVGQDAFLAHFADYEPLLEEDLATWKGFIERHPDQVLWGSDRGATAVWTVSPEVASTLSTYVRAFIGRLDPSVREKFAYKNAEGLLSGG